MTTQTTEAVRARPGYCSWCGTALKIVRRDRRFTLLDATILVAASAVAFLLVRGLKLDSYGLERPRWEFVLIVVIASLVTWPPTTLFLKLRAPRPTALRLSRQPDFVAMLAASAILALGVLATAILALVRVARQGILAKQAQGGFITAPRPDPGWWIGVVLHFAGIIGAAVLASWLVLLVSGRRRASRGWLNLLGRTLGTAWAVLFVIHSCTKLAYLVN